MAGTHKWRREEEVEREGERKRGRGRGRDVIGRLELGVDSSGGRTRFMKNCLLFGQAGHAQTHTHIYTLTH